MTIFEQKPWLGLLVAMGVWGIGVSILVMPIHYLEGVDAYYHVRLSEIMSREGWVLTDFPWATESIWAERFFDKEWLFHVLLIPFLSSGMLTGAKLAIVVLNLLIVASIWWALRAAGHRSGIWLVCLICLIPICGYTSFIERLILCRPHLLSICLLFVSLAALAGRRRWWLAIFSMLYALTYTGHWQLLGIVFIYDVLFALLDDEGKRRPRWSRQWPMLLPAAAGMLVGELVHPQFPHNVHGLFVQNVLVLRDYWSGQAPQILYEARPSEIRPAGLLSFLASHALILLGIAAITWHAVKRRVRLHRIEWLYAILGLGYLLMTFRSMRFSEYFVAVAMCAIGLYWHRQQLGQALKRPWQRIAFGTVLTAIGLAAFGSHLLYLQRQDHSLNQQVRYSQTAAWLADHAQPGEIVFATSWSDNPYLFYGAPQQRYLVFLDVYFMYAKSPDRLRLWHDIRTGQTDDPVRLIQEEFGSTLVFTQQHPMFQDMAKQLFAAGATIVATGAHHDVLIRLPDRPAAENLPGAPANTPQ